MKHSFPWILIHLHGIVVWNYFPLMYNKIPIERILTIVWLRSYTLEKRPFSHRNGHIKLALLDHDDTNRRESGTQATQRDETRDVSGTTQQGATTQQQGATTGLTTERTEAGDRMVTRDERTSTVGDLDWDTDKAEMYGSQMVDDIKDDLRELRRDVEQFLQTGLAYQDTH